MESRPGACAPRANAATISLFLQRVARRHTNEFIVIGHGPSWRAGALTAPAHMRLIYLPPSELNPAEHLWEAVREDCFAKHVFADLDAGERAHGGACGTRIEPLTNPVIDGVRLDYLLRMRLGGQAVGMWLMEFLQSR